MEQTNIEASIDANDKAKTFSAEELQAESKTRTVIEKTQQNTQNTPNVQNIQNQTKSENDIFMEEVITKVVDPLAEILVDVYFPIPPEHLMVSEKIWRQNKKKEISDELSGADIRKKVHRGIELIFEYANSQLPKIEAEKVINEWKDGSKIYFEYATNKFKEKMSKTSVEEIAQEVRDKLSKKNIYKAKDVEKETEKEKENGIELDMEVLMKISPATIDHFYAAGLRLFNDKQFKDSTCVFTVLTILNYRRHNVWLSLGMSLQYDQVIKLALQAFEMATLTDPDDPLPYIHSGECCIQKRDFIEALSYLNSADEKNHSSVDFREDLAGYINKLKHECK